MVTVTQTDHTVTAPFTVWNGKVALVAKLGGAHTGVGRYVHMLHRELLKAGVDTVRIAPAVPPLPAIGYSLLRRVGIDLAAFLTNYPLWAPDPQTDICHLTSQNLATLLLFRRPSERVIVTVHDIIPYMVRHDSHLSSYRNVVYWLFDHMAMVGLRRAGRLVAVSQYTKRCIIEHLRIAPEKIEVVYHGVDLNRFRPLAVPQAIRERYGLPEGRRYLIYVGSEDPRKNLSTLARALAQVRRQLPDVELVKVGQAHFNEERRRLVELSDELGIRSAIHFLDDVPEDDLPLLYNLADVCVMPSFYEGFGFPVLEAQACGTPVVCADTGSLPEVAGSAGSLINPHDATALADTLCALLENESERQRLGQAGLEQVTQFTWESTTRQHMRLYS